MDIVVAFFIRSTARMNKIISNANVAQMIIFLPHSYAGMEGNTHTHSGNLRAARAGVGGCEVC